MLTVMVVDDDPLLCTAMRRKIEMIDRENQLGIQETLIAHSAQEAWGILQEKSVDILISDIRMPYQTGLELADKVNEAFPEIQLVILSGYDDYEYMRSALRSGVVDYLLKPVKLVQIQEVLLKCQENLRRRKAQSLRNGNDREVLENWLNGLLAGKTGKPPVEFPHPVFRVAWPFGGEGEAGFRGFKPGFIRPFRAEILLSFISCFKKSSVGIFFRSSPFLRRFDDFMCIGSLRFRRWLLRIIWNWKRFPTLADLPV